MTRVLELRQNVLNKNDQLARELRHRFEQAGMFVMNLVSSPGSGKTTFLQKMLEELRAAQVRVAALVGDLETDNDARRLAESGAPVRQITTHGCCHLDAAMIASHLDGWELSRLDALFIENVGNLVCPSNYDLGESVRVALLSVTEGEDKPLKYPGMFNSADVAVVTKADLATACEYRHDEVLRNIEAVRPGMRVFLLSSKTGAGMSDWFTFLRERMGSVQRLRTGAKIES